MLACGRSVAGALSIGCVGSERAGAGWMASVARSGAGGVSVVACVALECDLGNGVLRGGACNGVAAWARTWGTETGSAGAGLHTMAVSAAGAAVRVGMGALGAL